MEKDGREVSNLPMYSFVSDSSPAYGQAYEKFLFLTGTNPDYEDVPGPSDFIDLCWCALAAGCLVPPLCFLLMRLRGC